MKGRFVLAVIAVVAAFAFAGCGGGGGSSSDPASVAPPGAPLFVEASVHPQGELKTNVETLVKNVAGIDDPGGLIVSKLDSALAESGDNLSYARDIEPWLGEKAAIFFEHYDGNNFTGVGGIVQTTDASASQNLIDKLGKSGGVKDASYKGVDYKVKSSDGSALGVVGDFLVLGEDEKTFKDAVDASQGDSLAEDDRYSSAVSARPSGSLADVYANIGGLIEQSGASVSPQALGVFKALGLDLGDATALASVVPGSDRMEVDLSTNVGGDNAPAGSAADLLGSFPAGSFAAFAASGFGEQLKQAIDQIDESGLPPQVPPHRLKSTLQQAGVDLDKIASSIGDAGLFAGGTDMRNLGGALVLTMSDANAATDTVANVGMFLRRAGTPGVTAVSGKASGFSVRSTQLGRSPVVVVAKGDRIAIGYGLGPALQVLALGGSGATLAGSATYKAAVDSLGSTPISGFVDGPSALRLAEALGASGPKFEAAKPYLSKVRFLALGTGKQGDLATTKVIVGFNK